MGGLKKYCIIYLDFNKILILVRKIVKILILVGSGMS